MDREKLIEQLSTYGKVEILKATDEQVEIKITEGFTGQFKPTMKVGEIVLDAYPQFKNIKKAETGPGLCHYIFKP